MNKQLSTWQFIARNLQQHHPVLLLYVLDSSGSSPGRQGFFMAVNANGEMTGSIGGGMMEHKLVELAKEKLSEHTNNASTTVKKQVHDKNAAKNQSGMICSGEQTVLLYIVQALDEPTVNSIISALANRKASGLSLDPGGIHFLHEPPEKPHAFQSYGENNWHYTERIGIQDHIHIIGGGHCSLTLSKVMNMLGFFVHVYDDRPELNTMQQNEHAHEKRILGSYNDLAMLLDQTAEDFAVIMTLGYRTDDTALRSIINKPFKYLGLLGSKKKIETMFNEYRAEGFTEERLARIHAPVGLNIKSETPEEIAISIAAEIIKIKNNADKNS